MHSSVLKKAVSCPILKLMDEDTYNVMLDSDIYRLYAVLCGNASRHVGMAGANGLAGRCLSLDMRR